MKKSIVLLLLLITFTIPSFSKVIWLKTKLRQTCNSESYQPYITDIKINFENHQISIWSNKTKSFVLFNIYNKIESEDSTERISEFHCVNENSRYTITIYTSLQSNKIVGINLKYPDPNSCVIYYLINIGD